MHIHHVTLFITIHTSCDLLYTAGMSLITNMVILEHDSDEVPPNHKEVMETADMRAKDMQKLVKRVIEKLSDQ